MIDLALCDRVIQSWLRDHESDASEERPDGFIRFKEGSRAFMKKSLIELVEDPTATVSAAVSSISEHADQAQCESFYLGILTGLGLAMISDNKTQNETISKKLAERGR